MDSLFQRYVFWPQMWKPAQALIHEKISSRFQLEIRLIKVSMTILSINAIIRFDLGIKFVHKFI